MQHGKPSLAEAHFPARPNFSAVSAHVTPAVAKWLDKLAEWCGQAIDSDTKQENRISDLEQDLADMADMKDTHERLLEDLADVPRGIRTLDEVLREYGD